jgi:hypothetical protein
VTLILGLQNDSQANISVKKNFKLLPEGRGDTGCPREQNWDNGKPRRGGGGPARLSYATAENGAGITIYYYAEKLMTQDFVS